MSDKAIGGLTVIPVRAAYSDTSEMITQLLFGEGVIVLEAFNQWRKIEIIHDHYQGWVDHKQLLPISENAFALIGTYSLHPRRQNEVIMQTPWGIQRVLQGSPIWFEEKKFAIDHYQFEVLEGNASPKKNIEQLVISYLNAPYLWGGRTKYGIDCSGFTQTIYHQLGFFLNRDASQQVLQGKKINFGENRLGDLAFFKSEISGKITHVGIILEENKIIHAHGRIRVDELKEEGIYNQEDDCFSHKLEIIKRIF